MMMNMSMDRRDSIGTMFRRQLRDSHHFQSAALEDQLSPMQVHRQKWDPTIPNILRGPVVLSQCHGISPADYVNEKDRLPLSQLFPHTWDQKLVNLVPNPDGNAWQSHTPLRVGVVLSGGQAPGGHNVISGVYDYLKQCNANSQLFGFLGGPHGIFSHSYVEVSDEFMDRFRNQGGFDMIRSGRHKIETEEQKQMSLQICKKLDLHGLIVIGGDDSNTNAAILAEYFKSNECSTKVIGVPKTIDGDLKTEFVEASFGFDTAVKTYSEFVGNLCTDVATSGKYYHFIRLMGRSASNITLECALQTRPNLTFVGEEVQARKLSLKNIVDEITDMVMTRYDIGRDYGVILLPEGLIEFIPEVGELIKQINSLVAKGDFDCSLLPPESQTVFKSLPPSICDQLLLDRDPHGNVQVAMIATERLLILMVEAELEKRSYKGVFHPQSHYFGYEGRCGMPSNFDANYCYTLGHVGAALIDNGCTGCMAVARGLHKAATDWEPAGCPLTMMMTIEKRKGKDVPVIKKYLVELDKPMFQLFAESRHEWKLRDLYASPGPIQFEGPVADISNYTIVKPTWEDLLPPKPENWNELKARHHFVKSEEQMSNLQRLRLEARIQINSQLMNPNSRINNGHKVEMVDLDVQKAVLRFYPLQFHESKMLMYGVSEEGMIPESRGLKVGVVITGQQAPGVANIVWGLYERLHLNNGTLIGFKGASGLMGGDYITITEDDLKLYRNQGGFELLGRSTDTESQIATPQGLEKIEKTCQNLALDGLVMIGGRWTLTDVAILTERFLQNSISTKVVGVPATQNNNLNNAFFECTIGFDSASKCYAHLIGNLLTDAASATKYWYFVRLMGRDKSHVVIETALQTHSNVTLVSETLAAGQKTLEDVVVDIADVICARSEAGKNFGAVLIPEGLMSELLQMRQLFAELNKILAREESEEKKRATVKALVELDSTSNAFMSLFPCSRKLLQSLPEFIREQIIQPRSVGRFQLSKIASEEMLSKMVAAELSRRRKTNLYKGTFSPVCFYFGYQARSSMPSQFDCALGLSHGYLAGICLESGLTGYVTAMRGLCCSSHLWRPSILPVTAILKMQMEEMYGSKVPMVPSDMVKLDGKAVQKVESASAMWEQEDRFCNPGPMQFFGNAKHFYNRYLFEQQHKYVKMLGEVNEHMAYLLNMCTFGVDETTLQTTCVTLKMLEKILNVQRVGRESYRQEHQENGYNYTFQMSGINNNSY